MKLFHSSLFWEGGKQESVFLPGLWKHEEAQAVHLCEQLMFSCSHCFQLFFLRYSRLARQNGH